MLCPVLPVGDCVFPAVLLLLVDALQLFPPVAGVPVLAAVPLVLGGLGRLDVPLGDVGLLGEVLEFPGEPTGEVALACVVL